MCSPLPQGWYRATSSTRKSSGRCLITPPMGGWSAVTYCLGMTCVDVSDCGRIADCGLISRSSNPQSSFRNRLHVVLGRGVQHVLGDVDGHAPGDPQGD